MAEHDRFLLWSHAMPYPVAELDVASLTLDERLALLGRLWDSLLDAGPPPVPDWHRTVIRERIAAADANPGAFIPLEDLRRELLARRS